MLYVGLERGGYRPSMLRHTHTEVLPQIYTGGKLEAVYLAMLAKNLSVFYLEVSALEVLFIKK